LKRIQEDLFNMSATDNLLKQTEKMATEPFTPKSTSALLKLIGIDFPESLLKECRIYSDTLPVGAETNPYSEHERLVHFIWDSFEKTPYSLLVDFSIPFRRLLAEKLFKRCGKNFICESNVSFNFGHQIALGDNVFFNRGVFIDSKAGVTMGDSVCLTEDVRIFTHGHSEAVHSVRSYAPVVIERFAKVYTGATILPGVTIGEQAIVGSGSIVTENVPPNSLVVGAPARVLRERKREENSGDDLDHIWLHNGQFQTK
jgi:acetyltransferase-like isoleucine patch superfamily enzyme